MHDSLNHTLVSALEQGHVTNVAVHKSDVTIVTDFLPEPAYLCGRKNGKSILNPDAKL